jgi:hypothetical protein
MRRTYNGGFGASGALPRVEKFLWKRKINTFAGKFIGSPACPKPQGEKPQIPIRSMGNNRAIKQ